MLYMVKSSTLETTTAHGFGGHTTVEIAQTEQTWGVETTADVKDIQ